MSADPKAQAKAALDHQEAIGRAVARGKAQALTEVCERLGLAPVTPGPNGNADAVERIAAFAKAPKA